jgi:hypothetical protein
MSEGAVSSVDDEGLGPMDSGESGECLTALLLDDRYSDILATILRALPDR